jgi:MFS family permease
MPVAARALDGVRAYGLAFASYFATLMLGTVAAGGWTDARGPRGPVLTGLGLFAGGLLVAGLATTFPVLLVGRAVSGLGGGLLGVALYVVVADVYPQELQPRVFGAISTAWVLPSIVGPAIAGWLASHWSWRAVFLVVLPLALLLVPVLAPQLRGSARDGEQDAKVTRRRLLRGLGLASGALALQAGVDAGLPTGILPVVAGALLVAVTLPALLPPGALRLARGLPALITVRGLFTGTFSGAEAFIPLMLVEHRGITPALAGSALTVGSLGWTTGSWIQGSRRVRLERTTILTLGAALVALGVLLLAVTPLGSLPAWLVPLAWVVCACGMGLGMSSMSVLLLRLSPPGEEGRSSAGLQLGDSLGALLGIGLAGALFSSLHASSLSEGGSFAVMWAVMGGVGVAAALASLRVRPRP